MFEKQTLQGAYLALSAYVFWGFVPIYFKLVAHVSPWEILCHRVLWSVFLLVGILAYTGQLGGLKVEARVVRRLALSATLLSVNWLVYIYSVITSNIVEASLGYFINPLISVVLGMMFLSERLRPMQWIAIFIALSGIAIQLIYYGAVPWIALTLACSFGTYGLIRKNLGLPSTQGLALETLLILPFALLGLLWLYSTGNMAFTSVNMQTNVLLIMGGVITSFPLLCFAAAVTRLSLISIGMFQYIAPSLSLIVAVAMYDEPFGIDRIITFSCIWVALVIFTGETIYYHRMLARRIDVDI
jgi:chloramphenicol-sensitive protein RarD|tara:strand:- start:7263 stop:8162 length:900 start_codon:yes stop_codon:yes gene_type:complete